jgi:hypothetical protein
VDYVGTSRFHQSASRLAANSLQSLTTWRPTTITISGELVNGVRPQCAHCLETATRHGPRAERSAITLRPQEAVPSTYDSTESDTSSGTESHIECAEKGYTASSQIRRLLTPRRTEQRTEEITR